MKRKKKNHFFPRFKSSWISPLITGIAIGIASQHIVVVRSYTEKFAQRLDKPIEQFIFSDLLQEVFLKAKRSNR